MWTPDPSKIITAEQKAAEAQAGLMASYSVAIQLHLDAKAKERHYDSIHTAISYRGDANPQYDAEADALFAWRSAVWTYATDELDKVLAGQRERPEVAEIIAELPDFVWPE